MRSHPLFQNIACLTTVLTLAVGSGCGTRCESWNQVNQTRFEKTIPQQIDRGICDTLDVLTHSGSITVTGADVADCNIIAKIVACAPTEKEAQELADQVEIRIHPEGSALRIRSKEPDYSDHCWTSVSYTILIPRRMNIQCESSFGSLDISHIEGNLNGKNGNGPVKVQDISGRTSLRTSFGVIECRDATGPSIDLHNNNGPITAAAIRGPTTAETSFGVIVVEDFADGDLKLKSGNGRIEITNASFGVCDARSSFGVIAGRNLKGDSVTLNSGNGSVEIDNVQTKTLDLLSSFGNLRATGVTASDISATSGNGGVHIACSPSAPADLDAQVRSTFGSVEFTAPAGFAGEVSLSTGFGSVQTALPVTVSGELNRSRVSGKVGDGAGKIHIESGNGSVELK